MLPPDFETFPLSGAVMMRFLLCGLIVLGLVSPAGTANAEPPAAADERDADAKAWNEQVATLTAAIEKSPGQAGLYSRRGDAYFFLGQFKAAQSDYRQMVVIDPGLSDEHWRLGIANFYAGDFQAAADQFDRYHSFDNVDRENGIWRYFSHYKALGKEAARKELLKYEKDDREPFPSVYKLFAGEMTGEEIVAAIEAAKIDDVERAKRSFYAHLYIGLNAALEGNNEVALEHLKKSTANTWGKSAGYGPHYMWQVGRLQFELLEGEGTPKVE